MNTSVALLEPSWSVPLLPALIALLIAFLLGGAGGYYVKALTTPTADSQQHVPVGRAAATLCPEGTQLAISYATKTTSCVIDPTGR